MKQLDTAEFLASFAAYVSEGGDSRLTTLLGLRDISITEVITLFPAHDFAALATLGTIVVKGQVQIIQNSSVSGFLTFVRNFDGAKVQRYWKKVCEYLVWAAGQKDKATFFCGRKVSGSARATDQRTDSTSDQIALVRSVPTEELVLALREGRPTSIKLRNGDIFDVIVAQIADPSEARTFMEDQFTLTRRAELMVERYDIGSASLHLCGFDDLLMVLCLLLSEVVSLESMSDMETGDEGAMFVRDGQKVWECMCEFFHGVNQRSDLAQFLEDHKIGQFSVLDIFRFYSQYAHDQVGVSTWDYVLGVHSAVISEDELTVKAPLSRDILQVTVNELTDSRESSISSAQHQVVDEIEI